MVYRQIKWEHEALDRCSKPPHAISFYFSGETIQPIVCMEFGRYTAKTIPHSEINDDGALSIKMEAPRLFVGAHEGYARLVDVTTQLSLQCPLVGVSPSLEHLIDKIQKWLNP